MTLSSDGNPAAKFVLTLTFDEFATAKSTQLLTIYDNLAYIIRYEGDIEYHDINLTTAEAVFDPVTLQPPKSRSQALMLPIAAVIAASASFVGLKVIKHRSQTLLFFARVRKALPAALGIEILCVASTELLVPTVRYIASDIWLVVCYQNSEALFTALSLQV
jgi:hypothetical protein